MVRAAQNSSKTQKHARLPGFSAMQSLLQILKECKMYEIKFFHTGRLNQRCIENLFCNLRAER